MAKKLRDYTKEEVDEIMAHLNDYEMDMKFLHGDDPILKKWLQQFFKHKYENLDSSISLKEYAFMMERDDKLGIIIE